MPILNPDGSIGFSSAQELAEYQKLMAPAPVTPVPPSSPVSSKSVAGQLSLPSTISTTPKTEPVPRAKVDLPEDIPVVRPSDARRLELQEYGYRNSTLAAGTVRFVLDTLRDYKGQVSNPNGHSFSTSEGRGKWMMEQDKEHFVRRMNDWTGLGMALRDRERLMWSMGVSSALYAIAVCYGFENADRAYKSISQPKVAQQLIDGCVEFVTLSGATGKYIHISPEDRVTLFERMFLVLSEAVK